MNINVEEIQNGYLVRADLEIREERGDTHMPSFATEMMIKSNLFDKMENNFRKFYIKSLDELSPLVRALVLEKESLEKKA